MNLCWNILAFFTDILLKKDNFAIQGNNMKNLVAPEQCYSGPTYAIFKKYQSINCHLSHLNERKSPDCIGCFDPNKTAILWPHIYIGPKQIHKRILIHILRCQTFPKQKSIYFIVMVALNLAWRMMKDDILKSAIRFAWKTISGTAMSRVHCWHFAVGLQISLKSNRGHICVWWAT